jgi:hypothetical protein
VALCNARSITTFNSAGCKSSMHVTSRLRWRLNSSYSSNSGTSSRRTRCLECPVGKYGALGAYFIARRLLYCSLSQVPSWRFSSANNKQGNIKRAKGCCPWSPKNDKKTELMTGTVSQCVCVSGTKQEGDGHETRGSDHLPLN